MSDLDTQAAAGMGGTTGGPAGAAPRGPKPSRFGRRFGWMANPAWERAPLLLTRFPGLLAAVLGAAFVLAVASAAQPLFISSASNEALHANIRQLCPWPVGLQVTGFQSLRGAADVTFFQHRDASVRAATQGIHGLGPAEMTLIGTSAETSSGAAHPLVRLMSRDGFASHIHVLSDAGGSGIWLPGETAAYLKVKAGATIQLQQGGRTVPARIRGTYSSLSLLSLSRFWCSRSAEIFGFGPNASPPALALADRETVLDLSRRLRDTAVTVIWEYPVDERGLTREQAGQVAAQVTAAEQQLAESSTQPFFGTFNLHATSILQSLLPQVDQTIDQVRSPSASVAMAGRLVALVVVAAVGVYWLDRRRIEAALLAARGVGPLGVGSKAALEAVLPIALASAAGWFVAIWLVRWLGPGSLLSPSAPSSALWTVVWTAVAGLLLLSATVAVAVRVREREAGVPGRSVIARMPWEIVILLLMAASLYEMLTRGGGVVSSSGQARVDILLILFPILFVAGGAGLAARGLRRALPGLRALGSTRSPAVFLATRRLAAASAIALGLVTAVALAVGILAYSSVLSASTEASSVAKADVFVGADVRVTVPSAATPPASVMAHATVIEQVDLAAVSPGQVAVTVLGIDPSTFTRGAYWDPSFSGRSLPDLLRQLGGDAAVPQVLVAGGSIPADGEISFTRSGTQIRYHVAATVKAFPTQAQNEVLVVTDRRHLDAAKAVGARYLLGSGTASSITDALAAAHQPFFSVVTAQEVRDSPSDIALVWLYAYLRALGILAGLIVVTALVLYLAARQRGRVVSYALARRMGLVAGAHRRALATEIGGMLLLGFTLGVVLASVGARLVYAKLDPQPTFPPPALFRLPWAAFGVALAALVLTAWAGARFVQRLSERADVSEVMRVAG